MMGLRSQIKKALDPLEVLRQMLAPSRLLFLGRYGVEGGGCRDLGLRDALLECFEAQHHLLDALEPLGGLTSGRTQSIT
jgi:hypothetical protein